MEWSTLFDDDDFQPDGDRTASRLEDTADPLIAPRRIRRIEMDMDITPMIDITFLLLIFFLVASRIDDNAAVELPTAKNGVAVTVDDSAVLTVVPHAGGVGVFMGESTDESRRIPYADIEARSQAVTDYVQRELMADVPKQQVLIRAAKGIKYQEVASIITAAGMAEAADVYVAVIEE